jgi:hypothetical protein
MFILSQLKKLFDSEKPEQRRPIIKNRLKILVLEL